MPLRSYRWVFCLLLSGFHGFPLLILPDNSVMSWRYFLSFEISVSAVEGVYMAWRCYEPTKHHVEQRMLESTYPLCCFIFFTKVSISNGRAHDELLQTSPCHIITRHLAMMRTAPEFNKIPSRTVVSCQIGDLYYEQLSSVAKSTHFRQNICVKEQIPG